MIHNYFDKIIYKKKDTNPTEYAQKNINSAISTIFGLTKSKNQRERSRKLCNKVNKEKPKKIEVDTPIEQQETRSPNNP